MVDPHTEDTLLRVCIQFDGSWVIVGRRHEYTGKSSQIITVPRNVTYSQLLVSIKNLTHANDPENDELELKYQVIMALGPSPPVTIQNDVDVHHFIEENLSGSRLPLCVNFKKLVVSSQKKGSTDIPFRPDYDLDSYFSLGTQSDFPTEISTTPVLPTMTSTQNQNVAPATTIGDDLVVGVGDVAEYIPPLAAKAVFLSKELLKHRLTTYALTANFQYKVVRSTKVLYTVRCLDSKCKWYVRSTRMKQSECFQIKVLMDKHTCSIDSFEPAHRQASSSHVGLCIKRKFEDVSTVYTPKDIVNDIRRDYGISITYSKAWRGREMALNSIRGSPEESYADLPRYFCTLKENNPGTITHIEVDTTNHFKYSFMALGVSLRGFDSCMRKVIAVDATFLKAKYCGSLFVATCMDGNNQVYPLAFGIADSENDASWTWFFQKLHGCIGDAAGLVFVSDRNKSIEKGIQTAFVTAKHVACMYHLGQNLMAKFRNEALRNIFYNAAKAYRKSEFNRCMREIFAIDRLFGQYLVDAGVDKWARSQFDGDRYTIMTTNIAECLNAILKAARTLPVCPLMEYLRGMMQRWFYERRCIANNVDSALTPWAENILSQKSKKSIHYSVTPINLDEYVVSDGFYNVKVSFIDMTCECRKWQSIRLPCGHVIAASKKRRTQVYPLCPDFYTSECLRRTYNESVNPVGDKTEWVADTDGSTITILPPVMKKPPGRPKKLRIPSQGESTHSRKCGRCRQYGHNRQKCKNPIATNTCS